MKIEQVVGGPDRLVSDGTVVLDRASLAGGGQCVTQLNQPFLEWNLRGRVFHACTAAAGNALAVAGTTAGFVLWNPAGSGVIASLARVSLGFVSGTIVAGSIMHGVNTNVVAAAPTGTAITPIPGLIGTNTRPVCTVLAAATIPVAQTPLRPFAIKAATVPFGTHREDMDGLVMLSPGTIWSLYVIDADTTPLEQVAVSWVEYPLA